MGESAKCRVWMRILHPRQVDALAERRLGIRRDRETGDEAIESKKSLGTNRASGCMAALLWSTIVQLCCWDEAFSRLQPRRKTPEMTADPLTAWWGPKGTKVHPTINLFSTIYIDQFLPYWLMLTSPVYRFV